MTDLQLTREMLLNSNIKYVETVWTPRSLDHCIIIRIYPEENKPSEALVEFTFDYNTGKMVKLAGYV